MKLDIEKTKLKNGKRGNICIFTILVTLMLVVMLAPISASARTIYVDDDRVQYPSADYNGSSGLWAAVDYANNASNNVSTIIVYPGNYTPCTIPCNPASLDITRSMTIQGIGYPVIDGLGFLQNAAVGSRCCGYSLIIIWAPDVTIKGFKFIGIQKYVYTRSR